MKNLFQFEGKYHACMGQFLIVRNINVAEYKFSTSLAPQQNPIGVISHA
jgi:hypothetical protein